MTATTAPAAPKSEARTSVDLDADRKIYITLQARAALAGFELVCMADGTFLMSRWGMFRPLADVAACEAFLARVGAPQ